MTASPAVIILIGRHADVRMTLKQRDLTSVFMQLTVWFKINAVVGSAHEC